MSIKEPMQSGDQETSETDATDPTQPSFGWNSHLEELLSDWQNRAWAAQLAHYRVASRLRTRNLWLGLPVVVLTTAVAEIGDRAWSQVAEEFGLPHAGVGPAGTVTDPAEGYSPKHAGR